MTTNCILALIFTIALEIGVPPGFAQAIAWVEHGGKIEIEAVSPPNRNGTTDLGVMQLNDRYFGHINWRCPETNIRAGVNHIKWLTTLRQMQTWYQVAICYNMGTEWLLEGKQPFPVSVEYAARVMNKWQELDPHGVRTVLKK